MANDQTEKVLFEIRLGSEQLKAEMDKVRIQQRGLTTDIAKTREMQKLLTADFKNGSVSEKEYGIEAQRLSELLRAQTKEQAAASKQLENLGKASGEAEGSINQLRAELALTTASYNALSKEERENSEAGKALQARTRAISDELKVLESRVGDNRRNVGNYSGSFKELVKEMVKAQAEQKNMAAGSKELADSQRNVAGFLTAAQRAAAQAGQTYEEATKTIESYAKAITPAVENLVALEAEQARIVETAGEVSEGYRKIGFQIAAAEKAVEEATPVTQSFSGALLEAAGGSDTLGGAVQRATGVQEKYVQVQNLARLAMGASTGAAKLLRLALIATGLGAFLVVVGSLITYFTQTAEGGRIVEQVMAQIGATIDVVTDRIGTFGKAAYQFFTGNFSQAAETARQSFRGIGDEIERETQLALDLSKARQQLERDNINNIDTNKRLLNQVERLKNIRDDETNSIAKRMQANEDAYKVELEREKTLADLAKRRVDILKQDIERRGGEAKASNDQLKEYKEAQNEYFDILEDAAGKQNELITNRVSLQKEAEEQLRKLRQDFLNLEIAQIDRQLQTVADASDQELQLQKDKLEKQRLLELSEAELTADRKKAIQEKYLAAVEQLDREHLQKLREQAAESQQIAIATQLARAREGSQEEFLLKAQAIQADLAASLAGIDRRQSVEQQAAQEARIRAEAARQQAGLEYQQSLVNLDSYLSQERTRLNQQYADGQINKATHEQALQAIERAGTAARIVVQQDYGRDATAEREQLSQQDIAAAEQTTARKRELAEQEIQIRLAVAGTAQDAADLVIQALGEETTAGQIALTLKKAAAVAEIGLNLQKELSAISANAAANPANAVTFGAAGVSQAAVLSGIAIAKAVLATVKVLAFADGGLVRGPGGPKDDLIPAMLSDGEAVMTAEAVRKFGPLLSFLNVAGGGKSFGYRDPMPAATLARYADGGVVRYDASYMAQMSGRSGGAQINYQELARQVAQELGPVFYAANKALPAPNLNLSELREKQNKVVVNEKRADR
ncbi:hypothetical protein [Hymenobacter metallicola]|uniref:Bacteriophage tail tape measure N-terminal domain-containing protein n=1 Tax=Hymenobacter metallicola TaxID=2563114 RepID=A0A4Z0PZG8_9BACT|nr:hypothetical protein [Hymenobacter metallicola]TGE22825.1 hypothetical protein E5K02_20890 [Hymenobacter metallicola]